MVFVSCTPKPFLDLCMVHKDFLMHHNRCPFFNPHGSTTYSFITMSAYVEKNSKLFPSLASLQSHFMFMEILVIGLTCEWIPNTNTNSSAQKITMLDIIYLNGRK